jgi:hypothetical protein
MKDRPALDPLTDADANDQALRLQLRALKAQDTAGDALLDRVLAQWRELHSDSVGAATTLGRSGAATLLGAHPARRSLWVGVTSGLLIGAVIASILWAQRPDPAIDELMQADVLSQMAIGEL